MVLIKIKSGCARDGTICLIFWKGFVELIQIQENSFFICYLLACAFVVDSYMPWKNMTECIGCPIDVFTYFSIPALVFCEVNICSPVWKSTEAGLGGKERLWDSNEEAKYK